MKENKFEISSEILEVSEGMYLGKLPGKTEYDIVPVIWYAEVTSGNYLLDIFKKTEKFKGFEFAEGFPKVWKCTKTICIK